MVLAAGLLWDYRAELLADLAAGTVGAAWDPERRCASAQQGERPPLLSPPAAEAAAQLAACLPRASPQLVAQLEQVNLVAPA